MLRLAETERQREIGDGMAVPGQLVLGDPAHDVLGDLAVGHALGGQRTLQGATVHPIPVPKPARRQRMAVAGFSGCRQALGWDHDKDGFKWDMMQIGPILGDAIRF